ncbi:MAG TPA: hypothetical protein VII98_11375 [Solirubrobacteraceae bacterium]
MKALLAAVLAALVTAAVLATVGLGADNPGTPATPPPTQADALKTMQAQRDAQLAKLASALGVTTAKLQSSLDTLEQQELDQKVKDNELTQAQADAIKACKADPLKCDRSNLPAPRFRDPAQQSGTPPTPAQMQQQFQAEQARRKAERAAFLTGLAGLLGVDEATLTAALKAHPVGFRGGPGHGGPDGGPHGFGGPGGPGMPGHGFFRRHGLHGRPPASATPGKGATYLPPNAASGATIS